MAGQVDRFGRPIPADPGYKEIINSDGEVLQMRTTLFLDDTLIATDDPDSDATRLSGGGGSGAGTSIKSVDVMASLRGMTANPVSGRYETQGRFVVGDGGGWQYDWDATSTATDDGVLVIKVTSRATGRFLAVRPTDGIMNALACGPAAADLGTRTISFDPTGVVAMGTELYRVTFILRNAGWAGLEMPNAGTGYRCTGGEKIGASLLPRVPFYLGSRSNARLFANPEDHVGIAFVAYGLGDAMPLTGGASTIIEPDHAGNLTFTQTLLGNENTFVGVSNVLGLAAGDTILVYLGAEITDLSGFCAQWLMTEIDTVTVTASPVGTVKIKGYVAGPMPTVSGSRGLQTHHTIRKVIGFQDDLEVSGFHLNNCTIAGQGLRNHIRSLHWEFGYFMHNDIMCEGMRFPRWTADELTGYDQGTPGYEHYGAGCILQQCYGTFLDYVKVDNVDGVQLIGEELSSRGTHIGYCEATWNSINSTVFSTGLISQTQGSTSMISVEHLVTKGGRFQGVINPNCKIGTWDCLGPFGGPTAPVAFHFSPAGCDRLFIAGQSYRDKKRFEFIIPIPTSATSQWFLVPQKGLIRNLNLRITCPSAFAQVGDVGINQFAVDGTTGGSNADISAGYVTARDKWFTISPGQIFGEASPNMFGYCQPRILVGSNGTTPAGTFLHVDIEMFLPEMTTGGGLYTSDLSVPHVRGGSGAPSANADFVGQEYLDSNASPRKWYKAVYVGSGASDWVALN